MAVRTAVILTLIAATASLAACPGLGHSTAPAAVDAAHVAPATTPSTLTGAQALAFARTVNLTAKDVPGFTGNTPSKEAHKNETPSEKRLEGAQRRCTKGIAGKKISSKSFVFHEREGAILSVKSQVNVAPSAALAAKAFTAASTSHSRACLSHYGNLLLKAALRQEQQKPSPSSLIPTSASMSIIQRTPPTPRASGSSAWRVIETLIFGHTKLPVYTDILSFLYGPAVISLESVSPQHPFPAANEERLYRLLVRRAEAYARNDLARTRSA